MRSLRFHKERYEFQCDRSDNQHDMTKKNTPVKSLRWESSFLSLSHDREMSHMTVITRRGMGFS